MVKFEYRLGLIFELVLTQGISSTKTCLSVSVDSIVIGLQIHVTVYLKMQLVHFIDNIYRCDTELYPVSGPSYTVDSACSSSVYAIEHAYRAMQNGLCDSAIVGGSNLCLHPYISLTFFRLDVLSRQGICRAFDRDGMHLLSVRFDMYILIIMNLV